jgi:hypothetical protein
MRIAKTIAAAAFTLLLAAACGSSGIGDIFGGGTSNNQSYDITGTVDSVDLNSRSIYLTNVSGYNTNLMGTGGGNTARVYYDDQTTVTYQSKNYRPQDLERGDQVRIRAGQSGNQLLAESMDVTYNARGGMTSSSGSSTSTSTIRGTVRSIDSVNRTIILDSATWISGFQGSNSGSTFTVRYDTSTRVDYQGQLHPVTNLERGDVIEVQVTGSGSNTWAQRIFLVRDVNH